MSRGMTKAERLREMERLYVQRQGGLTDDELAARNVACGWLTDAEILVLCICSVKQPVPACYHP